MLMWLELIYVQCLLYLYVPETLVSFSFFLFCFAFFPFSWSFPKNIFIKRVCVSCNPLGCNPLLLCWNPVDVFIRCHRWVLFYNVMIKSQFFSGLLSVVSRTVSRLLFILPLSETGRLEGVAVD